VIIVTAGSSFPISGDVVLQLPSEASIVKSAAWTYIEEGSIFRVDPASGIFGTVVTMTGINLLGGGSSATSVKLANTTAQILHANNTVIVVRAANATATVGAEAEITSISGAVIKLQNAFTYLQVGVITTVSPAVGTRGTRVTITGERLLSGATEAVNVTLNGFGASEIVSQNSTQIIVRAGDNGGGAQSPGAVTVVSLNQATITKDSSFEYIAAGAISSVSPDSGRGGVRITITGSGLLGGGTELASLTIKNITALSTISANATTVIARAGLLTGAAGIGDIVIESDTGALTSEVDAFTYQATGVIATIFPASGHSGTRVTLTGTNLLGGGAGVTELILGGRVATAVSSANETTIIAVANASDAGTGDVKITADNGVTISNASAFTYVDPGVIQSVSPASGVAGTVVAIEGTGLLAGGATLSSVQLNGQEATVVNSSATQVFVVATAAAGPGSGVVTLTADTGAQVFSAAGAWEYKAEGNITSVSPASGQEGTRVTLSGSNLRAYGTRVASVTLGGTQATLVSENNTVVVVTVQHAAAATAQDITLKADTGGLVIAPGAWTYLARGDITSLSPASGQSGTRVTIAGARLLGGGSGIASVTLAGTSVSSVLSANDTAVVVAAAARGTAGTGDVVVTSNTGAIITETDGFAYVAPGVVASVVPGTGQLGTRVTITGTTIHAKA
jgi:hypothetical protein